MAGIASEQEYQELIATLRRYERAYYVEGHSLVSDAEYDRLFDSLRAWEQANPLLVSPDSPSQRVGSDLSADFPELPHSIPVLSLDKAYAIEEITTWLERCTGSLARSVAVVAEEKIDGLSLVLYYRDGLLERALTRGNGVVGNDVTANVRTIRDVPLRLSRPVSGAFRGEVYLARRDFAVLNKQQEVPYANPRNLAGGTLRRIKSSEVARVPLRIFIYEGFYPDSPERHQDVLADLAELGFRTNQRSFHGTMPESLGALEAWITQETAERAGLDYEIDGLVLKVDDLAARDELGYTGHHPRWAIAWKFESPTGTSKVLRIDVQVGRTGRVTPVARVEPVQVGGATIQNVTLHNQDYVNALELAEGDQVSISRRGDVIPAVETVVEKGEGSLWRMPAVCPTCQAALVCEGAHHFCPNFDCPDRARGRLAFFVARDQMDIEGLGPETVDQLWNLGLVRDVPDLYTFNPAMLMGHAGFGEKKIEALRTGIAASLSKPWSRVLPSLGIPDIGTKVTELLIEAGYPSLQSLIDLMERGQSERLLEIHGLGAKTVARLVAELSSPRFRAMAQALAAAGLQFVQEASSGDKTDLPQIFAGQTWCVTGSFAAFKPRELAMDEVKRRGGKVSSDVSSQTTHLLAGEKAGSKLAKAERLGTRVVNETEFLAMLSGTGQG